MFGILVDESNKDSKAIEVIFNYFDTPKGRGVECALIFGENEFTTGTAICKPPDIFSKNKGRKIALTHALKRAKDQNPDLFTKEFSTRVWNKYFEIHGRIE